MHILNMIVKQATMIKTQKAVFNYTKMMKMRLNSTVKAVLKQIEHEIMILYCKCSSLDREEIKLTNIMKTMNMKIKNNNKKKMIIIRKLFSRNIILMLNSAETKILMIKKID